MQHTEELHTLLTTLLKRTARLFYSPHDCVILDILISKIILTDTEFLERLHILPKEFNKLIIRLKEDKLVKIENKIENIDGRQNVKTIYYLDYCVIKDVIKYKVLKITHIENKVVSEIYVCKGCKAEFSILEAQALMQDFNFVCNRCKSFLEEKRADCFDLKMHTKVMEYINEILELLKKIDEHNVPNMDYFQAMKWREEKELLEKQKVVKYDVVEEQIKEEENEENAGWESDDETLKKKLEEADDEEKKTIAEKIKVKGVEKDYHLITADDMDKMSAEEYEAYYEVYRKYFEE